MHITQIHRSFEKIWSAQKPFDSTHNDQLQLGLSPDKRRSAGHALMIVIAFILFGTSAALRAQNYNPNNYDSAQIMGAIESPHSDLSIIMAHRGIHALVDGTNAYVPENSLQAIDLTAQAGIETIELDVKLTSDGVPILSHDTTWGREWCSYNGSFTAGAFNPMTSQGVSSQNDGKDPTVNSISLSGTKSIRGGPWGTYLRDSVSLYCSSWGAYTGVYPPTVQDALNEINKHQISIVVAFDIKDTATATAVWNVVANTDDFKGRPFANSVLFKMPATAFPTTQAFKNTFPITNGLSYESVNYYPFYSTGYISSNAFGDETAIVNNIYSFWNDSTISMPAIEVNLKQSGGILTETYNYADTHNGQPFTIGIFSPFADYYYPSDTAQTPMFFTTTGYCCVPLASYFYGPTMANPNGPNTPNPATPFPTIANPSYIAGQPTDTADDRGSFTFVTSTNNFNLITTDRPQWYTAALQSEGKRNISYMTASASTKAAPIAVSLSSSEAVPVVGDNVELTAIISSSSATGTVTFQDGSSTLGTSTINNGSASYAVTSIASGSHSYTATYDGITSNTLAVTTQPVPTTCSPTINPEIWTSAGGWQAISSISVVSGTQVNLGPGPTSGGTWGWTGPNGFTSTSREIDSIALSGGSNVYTATYTNASGCQSPQIFNVTVTADSSTPTTITPEIWTSASSAWTVASAISIVYGTSVNLGPGPTSGGSWSWTGPNGFTSTSREIDSVPISLGSNVYTATYTNASGSTSTQTFTITATAASSGGSGGTSTCDIYASGGTPCVAAHSTVRALYGSYSGRLYQVTRASDSTTMDIGTLSAGGYANAAAQDTFCVGTTCLITMIYDQSSEQNNLTVEGPGGTVTTADTGASANALPITVNGNAVYGVYVTSGVGYRDNNTTGVAKGGSPEGLYMVTSGTNVNNLCCFDYGNAEANSADTGNGHMDAINFGTACIFAPCSGSGPWVEADLENGQYMGNGSNTGDQSINSDFVTAMLKNNGQTTFALKAGNAQSGGLTTEYSGTLPTINPGYIPMSLEGGIVLGTGGDNSDWGIGSFFEGAMTSGYPSDATESAVQANIVAAGYTGNSGSPSSGGSSGSGSTGYTGPNDPNGTGPQDGFVSPAIEQPNDIMATKPALATFNGSLYVAFQGVNANFDLYVGSSSTGTNFPVATNYTDLQASSAPSMAVFNNQLYLAFRGLNANNDLYITSSSTGSGFPTATQYTNIQMGGAPALVQFNNDLCVVFRANGSSNSLEVSCSSDGVTFPTATQITNVAIGSDPAVAVFNGRLYVAFKANDSSNDVWIASSADGAYFASQVLTGQTMNGPSSPALVAANGVLYYIYEANDAGNEMLVTASTDGSTWQGPAAYLGIQMGTAGPGAAAFGDGVSVGFQSDDSRDVLFVTNKATTASSYTGPSDPNGTGPQDGFVSPAIEQPNDVMATKPALAAFNGSLWVAFEGVNANFDLYVTSSSTGYNFPGATRYTNIQMSSAPSMAVFNNRLYVAFRGLNTNNDLFVTSSPTGGEFLTAAQYTNIQMGGAPALVQFNNDLCVVFRAIDSSNSLEVSCSSDGVTFPTATQIANVTIGNDPAVTVFNGKLYVAFKANDSSNDVWIASSSDGVNFSSQVLAGQTMNGSSSPALVAASNCVLYYIYEANDAGNEMLVTASTDGSTWQGPAAYLGLQMGAAGPGASAFGGVSVGFQSIDSRDVLFVTNEASLGSSSGAGACVSN